VGKLDPKSGKITEYRPSNSTEIDPHTPVLDHDGVLWFTNEETNYVGRLDPKTGRMTLAKSPTPHAVPYGIVVSQSNVPIFCEFGTNKLATIDPRTMTIHEYVLPLRARVRGGLLWHPRAAFSTQIMPVGILVTSIPWGESC
jgi:virginiamycin B lyase